MTYTGDELLDLEATSRRNEKFRFDVLDASNAKIAELAVSRRSPPTIRNNANATIPRTLDGVHVLPRTRLTDASPLYFSGDFDPVVHRIKAVHVVGPGGVGYEFPLGVFLVADAEDNESTKGTVTSIMGVDQCQILEQALSVSVGYPAGTNVSTALAAEAARLGIVATSIEATTKTLAAPIVGVASEDTSGHFMREISAVAAFLRPYFDNDGVLVCRSAPDLSTAIADHEYGEGTGRTGRIVRGSLHSSTGLLRAPNRYVVRDTSLRDSELVGVYDVAASAPHSYANLGYRRVQGANVQGLTDQTTANEAAQAAYAQDPGVFATITYETPIDSRHDTFDVIGVDAVNFIEHEWGLTCRRGSKQSHDVRRIYT